MATNRTSNADPNGRTGTVNNHIGGNAVNCVQTGSTKGGHTVNNHVGGDAVDCVQTSDITGSLRLGR